MRIRFALILVASAVACGDDGVGKLPDAPIFDDAPSIDAPMQPVKLTVTSNRAPVPGVTVYFQNADSSLVATVETDAAGVASAVMEPGGYVTAVEPFASAPTPTRGIRPVDIRTYAAVQPGDDLKLTHDLGDKTATIQLLLSGTPAGVSYTMYTSCNGFTYDVTGAVNAGSAGPPPFAVVPCENADVTVEAHDSSGNPVGSFTTSGVNFLDQTSVDLTDNTYVAPVPRTFHVTNAPADLPSAELDAQQYTSRGRLLVRAAGLELVEGAGQQTLALPPPSATQGLIVETRFAQTNYASHGVVDWGPSSADPYTLDVANVLLPTFNAIPTFDTPTHTISWTMTGGSQQPDTALAEVSFFREGPTLLHTEWTLVGPAGTSLTLPTLPGEAALYNPVEGDSFDIYDLYLAKVPGGYDALRPRGASIDGDFGALATGASGRIVYDRFTFGKPKQPKQPTRRR